MAELTDADHVSLWLMTSDGKSAIRGTLRRFRLPDSFDSDLTIMAIRAAEQMVDKEQRIASVAGWTKRALYLRASDLMKSTSGKRTFRSPMEVEEFGTPASVVGGAHQTDELEQMLANMQVADLRRHIGGRWGQPHPWRLSASLTYLSVALDGCAPGPNCPSPVNGADEYDAAHWAGLHYAGQSKCFAAHGEADGNTIRQRRKRHIDYVKTVLQESFLAIEEGAAHG